MAKILDLDLLFASATRKSKEFVYTHPEYKLTMRERLRLAYFLFLYKRGYSVAAITRRKEFFGLDFYVNKHVLIPRPETELLVEETLQEIKKTKKQKITLIDVGTGSGCIPIAVLKTIKQWSNVTMEQLPAEQIKTYAIDISRTALRIAKKNARTHKVFINFLRGNLLEPILKQKEQLTKNQEQIIITANLPYLTQTQFAAEKSIQKEPRLALVGGQTGLEMYEKLLQQIQSLLLTVNCSLLILMEIDPSQSPTITTLIKKYLPRAEIKIKPDLAGRDRAVIIKP